MDAKAFPATTLVVLATIPMFARVASPQQIHSDDISGRQDGGEQRDERGGGGALDAIDLCSL